MGAWRDSYLGVGAQDNERRLGRQVAEQAAEIERLREALAIYADPKNWQCTEFGEYHEHGEKCCLDGWWVRSDAHGYELAQKALGDEHG